MQNPLLAYLESESSTAASFAERIGVSRSYLSRLLSGEREADATILAAIQRESGGAVTPTAWVNWFAQMRDPVSGLRHRPRTEPTTP